MAKVIAFYVPSWHKRRTRWVPLVGQLIEMVMIGSTLSWVVQERIA